MQDSVEFLDYVSEDMVIDLDINSKAELLEQMLQKVVSHPGILNPEAVKEAVLLREIAANTGVGCGFAVPHARTAFADDFVICIARIPKGVDYDSQDGLPVHLCFMIVASDKQDKQYIKMLSKLMLKLKNPDYVAAIMQAEDAKAIYKLL